jgi:hypothetical protein
MKFMRHLMFGKKEMNFEDPDTNYEIVIAKAEEICPDADVRRMGNVKVIIRTASADARKRLIDAIHSEYKNAHIEEKDDRVVINIGIPIVKKLEKQKEKRRPLFEQIKKALKTPSPVNEPWIDRFGGPASPPKTPSKPLRLRHVTPRVAENAGIRQIRARTDKRQRPSETPILEGVRNILARAQEAYIQREDARALDTVHKMFEKYQNLANRIHENARVEGVAHLIEQAEAEVHALEWAKELEEKEKARRAVQTLKNVVDQIKKGGVRLRPVSDGGAAEWAAELDQKARVAQIRNRLEAPLEQIKKVRKNLRKIGTDDVQRRLDNAIRLIHQAERQRIRADRAAQEWGRQLDAEKISTRTKCKTWADGDRTHNPFNTSNRGRPLLRDGPTAKEIDLFCADPIIFCSKKNNRSRLASKIC